MDMETLINKAVSEAKSNERVRGMVNRLIMSSLSYKIDISNIVDEYTVETLDKIFHVTLDTADREQRLCENDVDGLLSSICFHKNSWSAFSFNNNYCGIVFYKGSPIMYIIDTTSTLNNVYITHLLCTLKRERDIKNLKDFLNKLNNISMYNKKNKWCDDIEYNFSRYGGANSCISQSISKEMINTRSFDNVFITDDIMKDITESVNSFMHNRDWYMKNRIPYHFGILLYGEPGTGKTSIAQAICEEFNLRMNIMNGDLITELSTIMNRINSPSFKDDFNALIIEDIDCGLSLNNSSPIRTRLGGTFYPDEDEPNPDGMGTILNCFDGLRAPSNIIYIFTTNHIKELDPALIRPGRIDLKIEIKNVCMETFIKFCKFHYDEIPSNTDFNIKGGITFAELQTLVMKGYTLNELCEYVMDDKGDDNINTPNVKPENTKSKRKKSTNSIKAVNNNN